MEVKDYQKYVAIYDSHESSDPKRKNYRYSPRQSDKILMGLVAEKTASIAQPRLLDLCCGYGNWLTNLRRSVPNLAIHGMDLAAGIIAQDQKDPELAGITFEVGDVTDAAAFKKHAGQFDVVTINAATQMLDPDSFWRLVANIGTVLKSGGHFINFDCYQPYHRDLIIISKTDRHPDGTVKHFYHTEQVKQKFAENGFSNCDIQPFEIDIDIPEAATEKGDITRTEKLADGRRYMMLGAVYQPWAFLVARKR